MSTYTLGIDIGGSKTQLLMTRDGVVVADVRGPSANPASVGMTETARQLRALLDRLHHDHSVDLDTVEAVCVGAAGVDSPERAALIKNLVAAALPRADVQVVHDTALLLAAAGTDTGIALIAGTGSVAWGRTADGREARAGGWGHALGDDGSGYGIARAAVRHVLGLLDTGQTPDTVSTELVRACGADRPGLLLDRFYARPERRYWAELSRVVLDLADAGDAAALDIVEAAAAALAELVERVSLRLAIGGPAILAGGVLVHQPLVRRRLAARLAAIGVCDLQLLRVDPAVGAVRLAQSRVAVQL
jgi:N-acetylglucosamine kinase-like BadF-type ATPase